MGNYQQVKRHQDTLTFLQVLIFDCAATDSVFSHLREAFQRLKPELRTGGDILDQVRQLLKEEE